MSFEITNTGNYLVNNPIVYTDGESKLIRTMRVI